MQQIDWSLIWEVAKGAGVILWFVAAFIVGWLFRKWQTDRAMLLRHEDQWEKAFGPVEQGIGELKAWRIRLERDGGPLELIGKMDTAIDMLTTDLDELKVSERERTRLEIAVNEKLQTILTTMATLVANVANMKERFDRWEK